VEIQVVCAFGDDDDCCTLAQFTMLDTISVQVCTMIQARPTF
jgi:hypothetical protein